ncbi:MAG: serine/threonine-protein kinase [Pyrinomonadaceae bacterium]
MNFADVIGQTLDEKYQIEREIGRGGMGTVYLATHLGTERPVAIKIIAPQFMKRPEFVERFRREARAAGRLRHPNVVDVTDFGFAYTSDGQVAYLVMEYLDGCTLGEILEEENNLPVSWTLDILEQVCSAVHEAHEQGIIHRDLKPDNIWLEPNQRGGYTVKVLDFGIAKLEEHANVDTGEFPAATPSTPTFISGGKETLADISHDGTIHDSISPTRIVEGATLAQVVQPASAADKDTLIQSPANGEDRGTLVLRARNDGQSDQEAVGTRLILDGANTDDAYRVPDTNISPFRSISSSSDLTRVGAVLGTPLYMSPEQCRGDKLDPRSDIYSLGIIAYQMLSGSTPFSGDFTQVMQSHKECPPPPLNAKKVRKKLKLVIASALAKDADLRPQTAEAFASALQSRSEGIFGLLRRAGMMYTEHMPKFLMLSAFFHLPMVFLTAILIILGFLKVSDVINPTAANISIGIVATVSTILTAFSAYLIIGTITWIVTQTLAVPLRPIKLRAALKEARKKWKTFAGTGIVSTFFSLLIGIPTCGLGFIATSVLWTLVGPVVMMENLRGRQALKRSKDLVKRSLATSAAAVAIMFLIPAVSAGAISFVVNLTAKAIERQADKIAVTDNKEGGVPSSDAADKESSIDISFGNNRTVKLTGSEKDMRSRVRDTVLDTLLQILLLPLQIVVISFTAIIVALLYLKTRQAGGESLQDLLSKFEETDKPRKKWQERVRQRLIQSGRITSRP